MTNLDTRVRWAGYRDRINLVLNLNVDWASHRHGWMGRGDWPEMPYLRMWNNDAYPRRTRGYWFDPDAFARFHLPASFRDDEPGGSLWERLLYFIQPQIDPDATDLFHCDSCPDRDLNYHHPQRPADPVFHRRRVDLHHENCVSCGDAVPYRDGRGEIGDFDPLAVSLLGGEDAGSFIMGLGDALEGLRPEATKHWGLAGLAGYGYGRWLGGSEFEAQRIKGFSCPAGCENAGGRYSFSLHDLRDYRDPSAVHRAYWTRSLTSGRDYERWAAKIHEVRCERGPDVQPLPHPALATFEARDLDLAGVGKLLGRRVALVTNYLMGTTAASDDFKRRCAKALDQPIEALFFNEPHWEST